MSCMPVQTIFLTSDKPHSMSQDYSNYYSDNDFWQKAKKIAKQAGAKVLQPALELYYSLIADETPAWAKAIAIAALGYLIFPLDLVPDFIPGVGLLDDVATMGVAITSIGRYVTDDIRLKAREKAEDLVDGF